MSNYEFFVVPRGAYGLLHLVLAEARLPTDDLTQPGRTFYGMSDEQSFIGYIGLEGDGPDRLLRSVAVLPHRREQGHGGELVKRLEAIAKEEGVTRLHLLTNTAETFFRHLGYQNEDRAAAPSTITGSAEFSRLCPVDAAYLVKVL